MIIRTDFSVTGFGKRWTHCAQLANYLARFVSANENDPERSTTLLSTYFNELLEAIFRKHENTGKIKLEFKRQYNRIVVSAHIPADDGAVSFYRKTVELANQPDPMSWYRERLEHDPTEEEYMTLGLLELAVVYNSRLRLSEHQNGELVLIIEFPLSEDDI